ncbi:histidinol-phosphate transaminase [Bifidobacterium mongoliense]|uniref:histidinol-phosphate transaminase n=1 Tax=Bifidobacterium mongoliense TaxID=518643 RepID=UPI002647DD9C|nr:histidinol-phosphate transaminase [Bifidobacterium mongoliense]MDN6024680.1 histidinol-phosphate transaminase [Bifidobacterium mongoliense]MDN6051251.1 histidinol-phosphate transaminase [Bifidobacterium mongoliense]MDN6719330.1 histidinol-phosphate transaminase [Bifidobacterium mongoliense]
MTTSNATAIPTPNDAPVSDTGAAGIDPSLPLRDDLIGGEPYGAPQLDVPVCLNVNENPYPLADAVVQAITRRIAQVAPTLNRYPDRDHETLRQAFCDYLERESHTSLSVGQLWAANGSNEIMLQLFQAFGGPGRTALGADPTYSMYPEYARDTFTTWTTTPRNDDFTLDVDHLVRAMHEVRPAIVMLTSPNNPTGTVLPMDALERVLAEAERVEVAGSSRPTHPILVVDEAYVEFRDPGTPSAVSLINRFPHLAVSRTMSKAFAFAGARVGYIAANPSVIDCLRIVRMPYHLSALTQAAALAALEHTDEQLEQVGHLRRTRQETAAWLREQTYHGKPLQVAESQSNFLLFGGSFADRTQIFDELLKRGVLIRVVGPEGWLRVCMGTEEEMATFRRSLAEVLPMVR